LGRADSCLVWLVDRDCCACARTTAAPQEADEYLRSHPHTAEPGSCTGRVALTKRPVHIHDVDSDPDYTYAGTHFAGDGLMVFSNDPVPVADHEVQAARLAIAMRDRVGKLAAGWRKRGYELGLGAGIAGGHATLGRIGFEGRYDYGALGSVTNLAARLSDAATAGQILLSQRADAAL
jgi:class 3 adenylate cyclase